MRFKDEVSTRMFNRYLESLDPQRFYFLQSDLADFEMSAALSANGAGLGASAPKRCAARRTHKTATFHAFMRGEYRRNRLRAKQGIRPPSRPSAIGGP